MRFWVDRTDGGGEKEGKIAQGRRKKESAQCSKRKKLAHSAEMIVKEAAKAAEEIQRKKTEEGRADRWPRGKSRETAHKAVVGRRNGLVGSAGILFNPPPWGWFQLF